MLTQAELKKHFSYDKKKGIFIRLLQKNQFKVGEIAGSIHHTNYIYIGINNKIYAAHRLAWLYEYGEFPKKFIDHINNNRSDNRIENLRLATKSENNRNASLRKDNKFGLKGVTLKDGKFYSQITINGKKKYIGSFNTPQEAHNAYAIKAKEVFGEFYKGQDNG